MTYRRLSIRDVQASVIAATATLVTVLLNGSTPAPAPVEAPEPTALEQLIAAEQAEAEGAWLVDADQAESKLGFAPEYDRLVWQVDAGDASVILDARTGEPLEFTFE